MLHNSSCFIGRFTFYGKSGTYCFNMFINFHRQGAIGLKGNGPHESSAALASNANPRIATLMQVNRKKTKKKKKFCMLVLSWVQILVKQRCMLVFLHILFHICFSLFNSLFHLKAFSLLKFFSRNDILLYINRKDDIQMQIAEVKYSTLTRGKLFLVFWLILLNKLKLQKKGEEISQRINIRKFRTLAHWSRGQAGQRPERMVTILVLCCQPEPNGRS